MCAWPLPDKRKKGHPSSGYILFPVSNNSGVKEGTLALHLCGQRMGEEGFTQAAVKIRGTGCDPARSCSSPKNQLFQG